MTHLRVFEFFVTPMLFSEGLGALDPGRFLADFEAGAGSLIALGYSKTLVCFSIKNTFSPSSCSFHLPRWLAKPLNRLNVPSSQTKKQSQKI